MAMPTLVPYVLSIGLLIDEQIKRADSPIRLDAHETMRGDGTLFDVIRAGEAVVHRQWLELTRAMAQAGFRIVG